LKDGYLPEALNNFLMFLGWNPGTEKEIYTLKEFVEDFSIDKVQKTDLVVFDRKKLLWFNGMYIRNMKTEKLYKTLQNWSKEFGIVLNTSSEEYDVKVLKLVQKRMRTLSEFNELTEYFYKEQKIDGELLVKYSGSKEKSLEILKKYLDLYEGVSENDWDAEHLDKISHEVLEKEGYTPKEAFMTIRVAVTGRNFSPPLFDTLSVLGKTNVVKRLTL